MAKNDVIKKSKNGTYYFRANLGYDANGKKIQKYKSGFKTIKEARTAYSKLLLDEPENLSDEKEVMLFKEYVEEIFLPWYKTQVKIRTYDNRLSAIRKHFSYYDKLPVNKIEPIHVQSWQSKLFTNLKPSYIRNIQGIFSMAMDRAVVLGMATSNPSKIIGNVKKQKTEVEFWTKEEFEKVISCIYKEDYYQHFQYICLWFLFMTGMRIGEATAIQWEDIDFETGMLKINKTLYYKNLSHYEFVEPKTKASSRFIVLDSDTISELIAWRERQQQVINSSFVMSYNGEPTQKHTVRHTITRFSKLADVHRIKIHALRHSHASLLIQMGENPLIIKDRLGHEDIETTLGTYGHLYPHSNFEVASKLQGVIKRTYSITNLDESPTNQFTVGYLGKKQKVQ
ncbi:site-specific integrase [Enterococcus faecalis]|uniref:site-specific integrase n=1 Tax=Enterococcus faecalis TaxID=1351 RepID=UPI0001F0C75B|nr:site-specific integrase [Enterococcus faecalis]EFT95203.1 site-specific recombinase, phage integrase family [Enterococcus faecalis TX0012]